MQIKDVPQDLYRKLKRHAARQGRTLRDVLLEAVRKEVARAEFRARLARRDPVRLDRPGRALEETRAERDSEIDS
ncbi:MAG: hypothetical protein E6J62_07985 [Deltaproteobacteria bacterium]|nr:MAG: hypothetical protein E6J85_02825 [Deltaproteobacteria bacterium]TMB26070.1 MAG: hypothetical protein E6J61_22735 [Deltaproteobacteria bacterium]TMB36052.1 MAG: hypothetical protein E6J62_07985 [Deltaproteobacteria bacterium]